MAFSKRYKYFFDYLAAKASSSIFILASAASALNLCSSVCFRSEIMFFQ